MGHIRFKHLVSHNKEGADFSVKSECFSCRWLFPTTNLRKWLAIFATLIHVSPILAQQVATAIGPCSVAINASGNSIVTVSAPTLCDAKTASTVQKLVDKGALNDRRVTDIERKSKLQDLSIDELHRRLAELVKIVHGIQESATGPSVPATVRRANDLLAVGDIAGAVMQLKISSVESSGVSAGLYREQAERLSDILSLVLANQERALVQGDLQNARDVVDRALTYRPFGDTGHISAFELLHSAGRSFAAQDFSGVSLRGAAVPGLQAAGIKLTVSDIKGLKASKANFTGARMVLADASGVDLTEAKLSGSVATYAKATSAILRRADLRDGSWTYVDLRDADLSDADLRGADLSFSDLRHANLTRADLTGAYLVGADLRGAQLRESKFDETDLAAVLIDDSFVGRDHPNACASEVGDNPEGTATFHVVVASPSESYIWRPSLSLPRNHNGRFRSCLWRYSKSRNSGSGVVIKRFSQTDPDRQDYILKRISEVRSTIDERFQRLIEQRNIDVSVRSLVFAKHARQLDGKPTGDVWITPETMVLVAIKHRPNLKALAPNWAEYFWLSQLRLQMEREWTRIGQWWALHDGWGRFFPWPFVDFRTEAAVSSWLDLQQRRASSIKSIWLPLRCKNLLTTVSQGCSLENASLFFDHSMVSLQDLKMATHTSGSNSQGRLLRLPDLQGYAGGQSLTWSFFLQIPEALASYSPAQATRVGAWAETGSNSESVRLEVELEVRNVTISDRTIVTEVLPVNYRVRPSRVLYPPGYLPKGY